MARHPLRWTIVALCLGWLEIGPLPRLCRGQSGPSCPPSNSQATAAQTTPTQPSATQNDAEKTPRDPKPGAKTPADALRSLVTPGDLAVDLVLAEPIVRQPLHLSFDERGRLWVVQYLQYPHPAGLKLLSRDGVWRAHYDRVPPPPPNHFRGADRITIHEDTDGDGRYDAHKTFLEGLNLVTSVARGRGGVWVLNPPYLLFYPDRDQDDVPDGDPEVHLEGFGLEDTHSIANSLCWGPDGWLYAAQGSTVTGNVRRPGAAEPPLHSLGQLIWRYHPETRRYEVFAEGGGNAFGVEIDSAGRVFSGHNGGNTRGFHYQQGAYLQKGFDKHGPLSNPYAFGYFPAMRHNDVPRFTHTFVLYEGGAFPSRYRGMLFGPAPLLNHVVLSRVERDGSTHRTQDVGYAISTPDTWFKPVDIKLGPDGAIYLADWYDGQINHYKNHEGDIDKSNGRIYRLRPADATSPTPRFALDKLSTAELLPYLAHENRWFRHTALRLLGDRRDPTATPALLATLRRGNVPGTLESLWALNLIGELDEAVLLESLDHANPLVRLWAARLACDRPTVPSAVAARLAARAALEPDLDVRAQLACSARRLPPRDCFSIVRQLLTHDKDAEDPRIPLLLWWAIESHCGKNPAEVVALFADPALWQRPLVQRHLLERLMRRFAATGKRVDLDTCIRLLSLAPDELSARRLTAGLETAYAGRSIGGLPAELLSALQKQGGSSIAFGLRQGQPEAVKRALATLRDDRADGAEKLQYVQILAAAPQPSAVDPLLELVARSTDSALRAESLHALARYDDPRIGPAVLAALGQMPTELRDDAVVLLASRKATTLLLLDSVDRGHTPADVIRPESLLGLLAHGDEKISARLVRHWPSLAVPSPGDLDADLRRVSAILQAGTGIPKQGRDLFQQNCARCHTLFGKGGKVGPDLTSLKRDDLPNLLLSVLNPSAEIREGYAAVVAVGEDGRVLSGVIAEQDERTLVLRTADDRQLLLERASLESLQPARQSLMPTGLLTGYTDQQLRDLFAYLRSSQPLID